MRKNDNPRDEALRAHSSTQEEEYEKDVLVRLVARRTVRDLDPTVPANARFFDWLASEARAQETPRERRHTEARADAFTQQMLDRMAVGFSTMRLVDAAPHSERQRSAGAVAAAVELAAQRRMAPRVELAVAAGVGREIWDEPCDVWVDVPDELPDGRYVAMTVAGDSMIPLIHGGDVVLVRLGEQCAPGEVIVARHEDRGYVVKRLGRVRRDTLELISLNAAYQPLVVRRQEVSVLGAVVLRWCSHGPRAVA